VTEAVLSVTDSDARQAGRRARILDAAARLFARFGFDKTSIDNIARDAGVSKGAVYLHWPSKDALFEATVIREGLRTLDDIEQRLTADPDGGSLAAIYRHSVLAIGANPLTLAIYTRDTSVVGVYIRRQDPALTGRRFVFGEEFVRRMQSAGLIRADLDPAITAFVMGVISFGLLGISHLAPSLRVPPLEVLADAVADMVHRGLATTGRRNVAAGNAAFRTLVDDTRALYAERTETAHGRH